MGHWAAGDRGWGEDVTAKEREKRRPRKLVGFREIKQGEGGDVGPEKKWRATARITRK